PRLRPERNSLPDDYRSRISRGANLPTSSKMSVTSSHPGTGPREVTQRLPDLSPEQIGTGFAPYPRDSVVSTRFDDEILIVDGVTGRMHVLNTTGALVWECLD